MKVTIEVDCTPVEARQFMGLPDVTGLNDHMVNQVKSKIDSNMAMMAPEELMKTWMSFGQGAQEQFRKLMDVSVGSVLKK